MGEVKRMELKEWIEIKTGEIFQFGKVDEQLVGVLVGIRQGQFNNKVYDLEYKDKQFTVFGNTVLDDKMQRVKVGDVVRITFLGEKLSKDKRKYKDYRIEIARQQK
jgi:hypothetical protein